ncbi:MAG TPA: nuclear transport factor 2 family protein [Mycobacterium sp.]|nr:nuclear transport factor 2 family protein [Mycobacterium sp.]
MTPEEQRELVQNHYALGAAGDHAAARELLTDDFSITIPPYMPFAGIYRGKDAFRELIPLVVETIAVTGMEFVATTVGDGYAVELVEFTLADHDGPPVQVLELNRFRGHHICESAPITSIPAR